MVACIMQNYQKHQCCTRNKHILKNDNHWNMFVDKIEILFDKYENVDITTMGFKENWKALLENDK